ncbi:hypothetical protein [Acinetobacter haemolyticus]|uniref:hypothetical protein n=1 Tax=Acinetobacter haemolyticus TaxID=29430 RepID=UPI0002F19CB8|nr:hypothetical protein [Acinetobacter haemolyticus]SUU22532.1 Putative signal peptide-containing protein [Acinetobacter haemolyticus]
MNSKLLLSSLICGLCFTVTAQANAKTAADQLTQKYQQVCKGKKQGDAVSFAYKGVVYNGACQNDENDKLIFQPPMPTSDTQPETQSRISETQSEPRPVSGAPVESAPTQIQSPNELAAPIENTEQPMMQNEQAAP